MLPDGTLDLVAPHDAREGDIAIKVGKRLRWIVRQRTTFADMNRDRMPLRYESGATHRYLGRQYRLKIQRGQHANVRLAGAYFRITTPNGTPSEVKAALDAWLRSKAVDQFTVRWLNGNHGALRESFPNRVLVCFACPGVIGTPLNRFAGEWRAGEFCKGIRALRSLARSGSSPGGARCPQRAGSVRQTFRSSFTAPL